MSNETSKAEIKSIDELLQMNLAIPNYQRPYKWTRKNVSELLDDIDTAIKESKQYGGLEYRIGSVILHKDEKNYNIVDGQQRIVTLLLVMLALHIDHANDLIKKHYCSRLAIWNLSQIWDKTCVTIPPNKTKE